MTHYHCLVAGLPEIKLDDSKAPFTLAELKEDLQSELSSKDWPVVQWLFRKHDNENLLKYLADKEAELDALGDLKAEDFEAGIKLLNEEENPKLEEWPQYMISYLASRLSEEQKEEQVNQTDALNALYFTEAMEQKNEFAREWFALQLNVLNILTALNCRKHDLPIDQYVVGDNEIAKQLKTNTGRDFGLTGEFEYFEQLVRISDEPDFVKKEKMLDALYWSWLEDKSFFYYFSIERLFVYILQLEIVQRWAVLDTESGKTVFVDLVNAMKGNVKFTDEFRV